MNSENYKIAVVIPYYNAADHICDVVKVLPGAIERVIIVNDKSEEELPLLDLKKLDIWPHIKIINNKINKGVGGAMKKGFVYAIQEEYDFVIKIDSDNQMDSSYIGEMIDALIEDKADMVKGNRFIYTKFLRRMPLTRKLGNLTVSFLTKVATGYWNNFDPTNGFLALKVSMLKKINFDNLANGYFFETSLLSELYFVGARVKDLPMPAIYADEKSSMKIWRMPALFFRRLIILFFKRILKQYFLYDFNIASLYLTVGIPLFLFGVLYGSYEWWFYSSEDRYAPMGTIMLVALTIILGFQLLLQAIQYDIFHAPKAE